MDHGLFLALNFDGGPFLDEFFWLVTGKAIWIPLYLFIVFLIYRRYGWRYMLLAIALIGIGVGVADQICNFFKNYTPRLRPTHTPELEGLMHTVRGYKGYSYGTVSAHAATTFFIASFSAALIRNRWFVIMIYLWTLLVCYSRIYIGAHFPRDIFFGILLGAVLAALGVRLLRFIAVKLKIT